MPQKYLAQEPASRSRRRRFGTIPAAIAAATALVASLAACGTPASSDDNKKVVFFVQPGAELSVEFWASVFDPFEEESGYEVEIQTSASSDVNLNSALTQLLVSGDVPDVVENASYNDELGSEIRMLDDQPWIKDTELYEESKVDGHSFTANSTMQPQSIIFYNRAHFEEAGITSPPTTIAEFEDAMAKLLAIGKTPLGISATPFNGIQLNYLAGPSAFADDPRFWEDVRTGDASFADSPYATLFSKWEDWIEKGYIDKDALGVSYDQANAAFLAGDVSIYPMGSWFVRVANKETDDEGAAFGAFAPPTVDGQAPAILASPWPFMTFNRSPNPEGALALMEYLTMDPRAVTMMNETGFGISKRFDWDRTPLGNEVDAIVQAAPIIAPAMEGTGDNRMAVGADGKFYEAADSLFTGTSADDAIAQLDEWSVEQE